MSPTSPFFYFAGMALFVLEGWILARVLPFHASAGADEAAAGRLTPLDGLRGVLALSVFFIHASYDGFRLRGGTESLPLTVFYVQMSYAPVTVFFFITGYLFWSKLRKKPDVSPWTFWLGRLGRLAPVYLAVCLGGFVFAAFESGFAVRVPTAELMKQAAIWLTNLGSVDLNGVAGSKSWLLPAWTLRFEALFYLTLPFLGWFARRWNRTALLLVLAQGVVLALGEAGRLAGVDLGARTGLLVQFLDFLSFAFGVGILAALLPRKRLERWAQGRTATLVSMLLVLITIFEVQPEFGARESAWLAVPFVCVCLGNTGFGALSSKAMRFLGRISYSFYLLHFLILNVALTLLKRVRPLAQIPPVAYWATMLAFGMATIAVCAFSYQWLEHPFLHVGKRRFGSALPALRPE